jgi:hypothetical protein
VLDRVLRCAREQLDRSITELNERITEDSVDAVRDRQPIGADQAKPMPAAKKATVRK